MSLSKDTLALVKCFTRELGLGALGLLALAAGIAHGAPILAALTFLIGALCARAATSSGERTAAKASPPATPRRATAAEPPPPPPKDSTRRAPPVAEPSGSAERDKLEQMLGQLPKSTPLVHALRFLRGARGDVTKAAIAYRERLAWLAELPEEPGYDDGVEAVLRRCYEPRLLSSPDKRGRPVLIVRLGTLDLSVAERGGVTVAMLLRRHFQTLNSVEAAVDASQDAMGGHLLVQDLSGCTIAKFLRARAFFRAMLNVDQSYYPEMLGNLMCINAPRLAVFALEQLKPWIDPVTFAKVRLKR